MNNFYEVDKNKYLSHIKELEQFKNMKRLLDKVYISIKNHSIETTNFLDPYSIKLAQSILNRFSEINYTLFGGFDESERKIVIIYPDYHYFTNKDLNLKVLRFIGDMEGLSHPDFLGAVLGLGIAREKVGDILLSDTYADIIIKEEVFNFIFSSLKKVGDKNFTVSEINFKDLNIIEPEFREVITTISSLRLDSYISSTYNLSRKNSQDIIKSGSVKVNYELIDKTSYELNENDLISVRKYGRSNLFRIQGMSKKNRFKVIIRLLL